MSAAKCGEGDGTVFMFGHFMRIGAAILAVSFQGGTILSAAAEDGNAVETVRTPRVLTDGYPDTGTLEGIVNGLINDGMSDQEKVLALYHWYRRVVFHHRLMSDDRRDVCNAINSFGCNLCGSQAAVFVIILNKAGFKTRVMALDGGKGFGVHTVVEVFYGGKWHCVDSMTGFAVFNRDNPPTLASLAELKADPTLVTRAVEENRAAPGFLYCRHRPETTAADIPDLEAKGIKEDRRWATFSFEGGNLIEFWEKAPRKHKVVDKGVYGGRYTPGVFDIVLKPNEEYVRLWDTLGKWVAEPSYAAIPPHHTCGIADEDDPVNFRFYKPYRKEGFGLTGVCYRYSGNGWLLWTPDAEAGEIEAACDTMRNLKRDGDFFSTVDPARPGSLTVPVRSPYAVVEMEAAIESRGETVPKASFLMHGKTQSPEPSKSNDGTLVYMQSEQTNPTGVGRRYKPVYGYKLVVETPPGTSFRLISLKTTFQLNMYSLPGLVPGRNIVTISAAEPSALERSVLEIILDWDEGEGWNTSRSLTRRIASFPATCDVEVAGPDMPRMKRVVMRLRPQAPERQEERDDNRRIWQRRRRRRM